MNEETQLKLQAYLDGELSPAERSHVESLLARDAAAVELLAELRHTNAAMADFEAGIKVPDSREFYWSKIQREISRPTAQQTEPSFSLSAWLRRVLVPAGGFAAVAIALFLTLPQGSDSGSGFTDTSDAVAFTYQNSETGATLVWLDYSAENSFSETAGEDSIDL